MSANRWGICPKCHEKKIEVDKENEMLYGKIPEDEYIKLLKEKEKPEEENLREDWEILTIRDCNFEIYYSCKCEVCGFSYVFEHKEKLTL